MITFPQRNDEESRSVHFPSRDGEADRLKAAPESRIEVHFRAAWLKHAGIRMCVGDDD